MAISLSGYTPGPRPRNPTLASSVHFFGAAPLIDSTARWSAVLRLDTENDILVVSRWGGAATGSPPLPGKLNQQVKKYEDNEKENRRCQTNFLKENKMLCLVEQGWWSEKENNQTVFLVENERQSRRIKEWDHMNTLQSKTNKLRLRRVS